MVEPDAKSTGRQIVTNCLALLVVGLLPTLVGLAGPLYFVVALRARRDVSGLRHCLLAGAHAASARQLLFASLLYLPLLLIVMALDKVPPLVRAAMNVGTQQQARNRRTGLMLIGLFALMFVGSVIYIAVGH